MKKLFLAIILFFLTLPSAFASSALVQDIFSDISSTYPYLHELQELYDRGMILPDSSGKFSPQAYLNRDEFVGISMEVICEKCIAPHTKNDFIEKYSNKEVYFDINPTNPYFYCVAEADARNYVRGYDIGHSCENGTNKSGERPFCPLNRINLEEAVAVLLRNSGIFTIEDNQNIVNQIRAGVIQQKLGNDVLPADSNGNPYTFYGYLQKALSFQITEYDEKGNSKILKLLELDNAGNVNPQKSITKEEFLKMSYIALKSNSCSQVTENQLALSIDIWEKSCKPGDTNCTISKLDDPEDTYDFTPDVEGFCEDGIDDPTGYTWRFYNLTTGEEFFKYGKYIDNYNFLSSGEWRIYLTVKDRCGNLGKVYSTIYVTTPPIVVILPPVCTSTTCGPDVVNPVKDPIDPVIECDTTGCLPVIPVTETKCSPGETCVDITLDPPTTTCPAGLDETSYTWTFTKVGTGEQVTRIGKYIDNYSFLSSGRWKVKISVKDKCGKGYEDEVYLDITTPPIVVILPPVCTSTTCGPDVVNPVKDPIDPVIECDTTGCLPVIPVTETKCSPGETCVDITLDPPTTTCPAGLDETSYTWTFTKVGTGEQVTRIGKYIDNYSFLSSGRWKVKISVKDKCGKGYEDEVYLDITTPPIVVILPPVCTSTTCGPDVVNPVKDPIDPVIECDTTGCLPVIPVTETKCSPGETCVDITLDPPTTTCPAGLDETSYTWTFTKVGTGEQVIRTGKYIDNYSFLSSGRWKVKISVKDKCGKGYEDEVYLDVTTPPLTALDVDILANPIIGFQDLLVNFQSVVHGGVGPFLYDWDFGDGTTTIGKNIDHLYQSTGIFEVILRVTDSEGRTGSATVLIKVLDGDRCLQDTDGDGGNDCEDMCPLVPGVAQNLWCPIHEVSCSVTCGCETGYVCSDNNPLTCGAGVCLPSFDPKSSCLYNPEVGSIFGSAVCRSCPCATNLDFLADIRKCDFIFPAITSPNAKEIYSKGKFWQIQ